MTRRLGRISWLFAALSLVSPWARGESPAPYARRWFYTSANLQVEANADHVVELIGRAKAAGYTGMVLADYKLNILDRVPDHYFRHAEKVKAAADSAGIEIVPCVFPIGYSAGLLAHDPNLAEGIPVEGARFLVRGREAVHTPSPDLGLPNGDLEASKGDTFSGFRFQDDPGTGTFVDREIKHGGAASCRIDLGGGGESPNKRLMQQIAVRPFACYRFSAWIKTSGLRAPGSFRLLALGAGKAARPLTFYDGDPPPDRDWTRVEVVFNSLDNDRVNLYAGLWGGRSGTLWIDDLEVEEVGLVNVLRRPGCPLTVTSDDGKTTYEEGRDFEPVADPKLGNVPYAGEFEFNHEPAKLTLTAGSRIRDGQPLRVSWYHPLLVHGSQVMCCPSEPAVYELLEDQAKRVKALFGPKTYFMSHDEIRVMNWCRACRDRKLSPGAILADNARRCVEILERTDPEAEIAVWSDMFDPHHNATKDYYLVNGDLSGSWEGLPPKVTIANWNGGHMRESLDFFAKRGHRQVIAGYYDTDDLSGFTGWDEAARGLKGVDGFLYTTWQDKYRLLEAYGAAMRRSD